MASQVTNVTMAKTSTTTMTVLTLVPIWIPEQITPYIEAQRGANDTPKNALLSPVHIYLQESPGVLEVHAFICTALLVCGVFSNLIAFGVFSSKAFTHMSFKVFMKVQCCTNIVILFLGTIRHQTFLLDYRTDISIEKRRRGCTYFLWYIMLFDHFFTCSLALILYNRIKAQRTPDICLKSQDAIRVPILTNTIMLFICMVPVSSYVASLDTYTKANNYTECGFTYFDPFRDDFSTELVVSTLLLVEDGVVVGLLLILLVEVFLKIRREKRRLKKRFDSVSSVGLEIKCRASSSFAPTARPSLYGTTQVVSMTSALTASRLRESIHSLDLDENVVNEEGRDANSTTMTVITVMGYLLTGTGRRLIHSPILQGWYPVLARMTSSFSLLSTLDILFYIFLAGMFPVWCASSDIFREEASNMLFQVGFGEVHDEIVERRSFPFMSIRLRKITSEIHRILGKKQKMEESDSNSASLVSSPMKDINAVPLTIMEDFSLSPDELRLLSDNRLQMTEEQSTSDLSTQSAPCERTVGFPSEDTEGTRLEVSYEPSPTSGQTDLSKER